MLSLCTIELCVSISCTHYSFWRPNYSIFGLWEPPQTGACVLLSKPYWSLIISLLFDTGRPFRLILYIFFLSQSGIGHISDSKSFFSENCDLDTTVWMLGVFIANVSVIVFMSFQWTKLGNIYFLREKISWIHSITSNWNLKYKGFFTLSLSAQPKHLSLLKVKISIPNDINIIYYFLHPTVYLE